MGNLPGNPFLLTAGYDEYVDVSFFSRKVQENMVKQNDVLHRIALCRA